MWCFSIKQVEKPQVRAKFESTSKSCNPRWINRQLQGTFLETLCSSHLAKMKSYCSRTPPILGFSKLGSCENSDVMGCGVQVSSWRKQTVNGCFVASQKPTDSSIMQTQWQKCFYSYKRNFFAVNQKKILGLGHKMKCFLLGCQGHATRKHLAPTKAYWYSSQNALVVAGVGFTRFTEAAGWLRLGGGL